MGYACCACREDWDYKGNRYPIFTFCPWFLSDEFQNLGEREQAIDSGQADKYDAMSLRSRG